MVWNDEQFFAEAERLVNDRDKMKHMDRKCAEVGKNGAGIKLLCNGK